MKTQKVTMRLPESLIKDIKRKALDGKRSLTKEVELRLEQSLTRDQPTQTQGANQ